MTSEDSEVFFSFLSPDDEKHSKYHALLNPQRVPKPQGFMGQKQRRPSSASKIMRGDLLQLNQNTAALKLFAKFQDKEVLFSGRVLKVNKRCKMQERILVITSDAIYNILDQKSFGVKRRIDLVSLHSISTSTLADNFFCVHVPAEYDYLYISERKTEILLVLLQAFEQKAKHALPIFFSDRFIYCCDAETKKEVSFSEQDGVLSITEYF